MLEAMVAVAVMGIMVAVGVPRMNDWVQASKAGAAAEFYAEGIKLARAQAVGNNSSSRFLLIENPANGQMDWQVDICFPTPALPCSDESGVWSSTATVAGGDPDGAGGFKSVWRSGAALPASTVQAQSFTPVGATDIYFTSLGWVNTTIAERVTRITLAPAPAKAGAFPTSALAISLAGMVTKCDPNALAHDSRGCPP